MKKIGIILMAGLLCWGCDWFVPEDTVFDYNKKSAGVITANNDFGLELFNIVMKKESLPNIMISPASISLAMGMAYNGADGTTLEAFDSVFNYEGLTRAEVNEITKELIHTLVTNSRGNLLEIANSVWYRTGFPVYQSFIETNKTYYNAEVRELDFSAPSAIDEINDWVADKTHNKIDKIIEELSPQSMLLLINALYFNCKWEIEFDPDDTKQEMFYNEDQTNQGEVAMMTTESNFSVASIEDITAVQLPYKNKKFSMYLFLPDQGTTVAEISAQLDGAMWAGWMEEFREHNEVQVTMPKFTFEYQRSLLEDLSDMGLGVAFTDQADFSAISDIDLLISKVIHKTFIQVDEEGTEAAAVTAVEFELTSTEPEKKVIRLDRPFLFVITENSSNAIVFMGKLGKPE
ncbi:MAG: serpin family protein [Bacteroidales bacterium]